MVMSSGTASIENGFDDTSWADALQKLDPKYFAQSFFSQLTRPDGRLFSICRPTKITRGVLQKHDTVGSTLVQLGNTHVLCGITLQIGTPTVVSSSGDVVVSMVPPSGTDHDESTLQTILNHPAVLDLTSLCIIHGQAAWRIHVTIQVLQDDGNVWDATLIAAVAAMTNVRLPPTTSTTTTTRQERNESTKVGSNSRLQILETDDDAAVIGTKRLAFQCIPVPLTMGVYISCDNSIHLIADPTPDEESLLQGYLTMVVTDDDEIIHTMLASRVGLTREHLAIAAQMAYGRGREIRVLLTDETL